MIATIWSALGDPWGQVLVRRALVELLLLGVAGGALGAWVVSYRLSYSAESLAHAMLPGLVVAALTGAPLLLGGAAGILVAALAVALAGRVPGLGRDTGVAVVVTTLFGLGALLALAPDTPAGLSVLLFGDVLGVSNGDLALAAGLVVLVLAALRVLHPRLLVLGFDRVNARAFGVSPLAVDAAVLVLVALAIVVAVQGLGSLLVVAVLVAPAAAAAQLSDRMGTRLVLGSLVAVLAAFAGLYLSYYADVAAGASVAGALVAACALAWAVNALRPGRNPGTRPAG